MDIDDHQGLMGVLNKKKLHFGLDPVVLVVFSIKAPVSLQIFVGLGLYLIPGAGVTLKNYTFVVVTFRCDKTVLEWEE